MIARSAESNEDQGSAEILPASEKDRAENIIVVDLARRDLSRLCSTHSIEVTALCDLESYTLVHQLVSVIRVNLQEAKTLYIFLRACFSGGSVTGVPKVRSMEIIVGTERVAREIYCAAIRFNGHMDTNIVIAL